MIGFEKEDDARRMMAALKERLARFGLAIHKEKTRLIEVGRLPAFARRQRGLRCLETVALHGFTNVLLGLYGYYGRPQNFPALTAFRHEMLPIWLTCLRRRSQKPRRMTCRTFAALLVHFLLPIPRITHSWNSRVREIRMPGSARAKAEWLSYLTNPAQVANGGFLV